MADAFRLLLPIRLVTVETEIRGHISPGDERITDILQRGDTFRILPQGAGRIRSTGSRSARMRSRSSSRRRS